MTEGERNFLLLCSSESAPCLKGRGPRSGEGIFQLKSYDCVLSPPLWNLFRARPIFLNNNPPVSPSGEPAPFRQGGLLATSLFIPSFRGGACTVVGISFKCSCRSFDRPSFPFYEIAASLLPPNAFRVSGTPSLLATTDPPIFPSNVLLHSVLFPA